MNAIFFIFCSLSLLFCIFNSPESAILAMTEGANKAITLSFTLLAVYSVWLGVYKILDLSGSAKIFARPLCFFIGKIFKVRDKKTKEIISLNIICNALGLGGIATPLGVKACQNMHQNKNNFGYKLLVVISATSIQLLPTSVISLAQSYGAKNSHLIILPALICTAFSTAVGVLLFLLSERFFAKIKRSKR